MGQSLAYALLKEGWQVSIFDKGQDSACSLAAGGLLTPVTELEKHDPLIFDLGMESLKKYWPCFIQDLPGMYFKQTGSLVLCHPQDQEALQQYYQKIVLRLGGRSSQYCKSMNNHQIQHLEPTLKKFDNAYFFESEGHLDTQQMIHSLKSFLIAQGVSWYDILVSKLIPNTVQAEETYHFDCVFDCRGIGSKPVESTLRGVRGELLYLYAPTVFLSRPIRFLHPRYSLYIVPRANNVYVVGASEIEAEDYSSISVKTTLELLTAAYYVDANFEDARILKSMTQCRPTFPNHLPKIEAQKGLIKINGLSRHGFLIAPALAAETVRYLHQGQEALRYSSLWSL